MTARPPVIELVEAALIHAHTDDGQPLGLAPTSLTIHDTSWTALIGPNGSGKSTLAALAAGLAAPTAGTVRLFDNDPSRARTRTAVATQDTALDHLLTVAENLTLAARLAGRSRDEAHHAAAREAQAFGLLDDFFSTRVVKLSGGLARRAHAARAFATDRELIVLDEPDAGLDAQGIALLSARCRRAADLGTAVVTVTHEPDLARAADRVIALAGAHVVADAPPADLLESLGRLALRCAHPLAARPTVRTITDAAGTLAVSDDDDAIQSLAADAARAGHAVTLGPPTLADAARLLAREAHTPAGAAP